MRINRVNLNSQKIAYGQNASSDKPLQNKKALDKIHSKIINSADMNDCVWVPRTIFKGYLGIMTGTVLASIAPLVRAKQTKLALALNVLGGALCIYGTFSFVRPYIIKKAPGVLDTSKK